jgi:transposase
MEIETNYTKTYLLPPSIEEWIEMNHPARFIKELVDNINLEDYGFRKVKSKEGRPRYSNNLLLKIWLYSYYEKIYSSRSIERACRNQIPLIWLTTMNYPDHNTIWRFFKDNKEQIKNIFKLTVKIAVNNEMVGFALQAIDGTKIKANVSEKGEIHLKDIEKVLSMIESSIDSIFEKVEETEKQEKEKVSDKLPKKYYDKMKLKEIIKEGVEKLTEKDKTEIKEKLQSDLQELKDKNRKQLNITDIDSRLMKSKSNGKMEYSYNVQGVVDSKHQIIVGSKATNQEADNHLLTEMLEEVINTSGKNAEETLADAGYFSGEELAKAEEMKSSVLVNLSGTISQKEEGFRKEDFYYDSKTDNYVCSTNKILKFTGKTKKSRRNYDIKIYRCKDYVTCPYKVKCTAKPGGRQLERTEFDEALERQKQRHKNEDNQALLKQRKKIVEPLFAWIKHNNKINRWSYRGLESVDAQWSLLCSAINLKKLFAVWAAKGLVID